MDTVIDFKDGVRQFLKVLICLVHVTGGQPSRGTELTILQHKNGSSSSSGSRNIYIDRNMVCIHSRYHKNIIKANCTKDIFRFLPPQVGNLLVYYLWLVLPYHQNIISFLEKKEFHHLFMDG
jgi:hypothetical protein